MCVNTLGILCVAQEEELDDLAGQVQMLEGARTRLEMSTEQMRKENRKEVQQREEEVEEVRIAAQKKVKGEDTFTDRRPKLGNYIYMLVKNIILTIMAKLDFTQISLQISAGEKTITRITLHQSAHITHLNT